MNEEQQRQTAIAAIQQGKAGAGGQGREAARPRPLPCPIQTNPPEMADVGRIPFLPRSALACWWSIMHLIRTSPECYLWTFTTAKVYPDEWVGNMHGRLIANVKNYAQRRKKTSTGGRIPKDWGGVRVFEEHENRKGGGLHVHWVVRGYMDYWAVRECSDRAGFGRISVEAKPVKKEVAFYLANYLTKGARLRGVRSWANIGTYDGIGKRDIEMTSARIVKIKHLRAYYIQCGDHPLVAYQKACYEVSTGEGGKVPF